MMRLLLPLTLVVLVTYVVVIPFYFLAPFRRRDVLIVYNLMLFAVVGLLLGATPVREDSLSPDLQRYLRAGIIGVAALAALVSVYALSAVAYRTIQGGLTLNRLAVIGWDTINIGLLVVVVVAQLRQGRKGWIERLQAVFARASTVYLAWGLILVLALPILF